MNYKWIGAILILAGCGGTGISIAAQIKREEAMLRQLISSLNYMHSQLAYQLMPLPQLCRQTAAVSRGIISKVFSVLAKELDRQVYPQAQDCMHYAVSAFPELPKSVRLVLRELGRTLGQMSLPGQLQGLEAAAATCQRKCDQLSKNQEQRLRSYQTLSLCAGAALAILLL